MTRKEGRKGREKTQDKGKKKLSKSSIVAENKSINQKNSFQKKKNAKGRFTIENHFSLTIQSIWEAFFFFFLPTNTSSNPSVD